MHLEVKLFIHHLYPAHVRRDTIPTLMTIRRTQIRMGARGMDHLLEVSPPSPRSLIMESYQLTSKRFLPPLEWVPVSFLLSSPSVHCNYSTCIHGAMHMLEISFWSIPRHPYHLLCHLLLYFVLSFVSLPQAALHFCCTYNCFIHEFPQIEIRVTQHGLTSLGDKKSYISISRSFVIANTYLSHIILATNFLSSYCIPAVWVLSPFFLS